jgi:hypothetical protein
MKNILIIALFMTSFIACKTDASKTETKAAAPVATETKVEVKIDSTSLATYVCPMDADITSHKEGDKCSKCGMALVLKK